MAYSSVRVQFEIGHEASVRTKKTPDGFTHDWEVFVKGADNTDIQYFVDKVVFYLHETFARPKRVIKDPPYVVKESGYAGFVLLIDVYLKNKEEPKKISFQYDLTLQNSGPPISRVLREPRVFQNPSEDFRRKLIQGGGVGVDTPNEVHLDDHKSTSNSSLSKSKPAESPNRKHKPELKLNDSFAELFGTPIRRITPEPKKVSELSRKITDLDKDKKKSFKSLKEEKDIAKEKDKYTDKDRLREREKNKVSKQPPPPALKPKEEHKKYEEKERKKEDYEEKKRKKEEREKKEKHKDKKDLDKQIDKEIRKEKKDSRDTEYSKKLNSVPSKSHENKISNDKNSSEIIEKDKERFEKEKHKHRHKKKEKEKNREKEKHKKEKDKSDRESKERNREKEKFSNKKHEEPKERDERIRKKSKTPSPTIEKMKKGPLNALLVELGSSDSASPLSEDEDSIPSFKPTHKTPTKTVPENKIQSTVNMSPKLKSTNLNSSELKTDKDIEKHQRAEVILGKNRRDKSPGKKNKRNEVELDKRRIKEHRRRSTSSEREKEDDETEKQREDVEMFEKGQLEKERMDEDRPKQVKKDMESNRKRKREKAGEPSAKAKKEMENESNISASQSSRVTESLNASEESRKVEKFTKEYVAQLKDLQHKIMTLEDNDDLQKVVQVIAETGQFEITKKTFDFDLCALDCDTIRRLQEFFSLTT